METNEAILSSVIEKLTYLELDKRFLWPQLRFTPPIPDICEIEIDSEYVHIYVARKRHSPWGESMTKISLFETEDLIQEIDDFIWSHVRIESYINGSK